MRRVISGALVNRILWQKAEVTDRQRPLSACRPQALEILAVLGTGSQVLRLVGVPLQIVELFGGLGLPEVRPGPLELARVVKAVPHGGGRGLEHVLDVLPVDAVRHEVADVHEAAVGHAANHVVAFVHPAAKAVDIRLGRRFELTGEGVALEVVGRLDAGQAQHSRREVNEPNQALARAADRVLGGPQVLELLRYVQDQRDVEAGVVRPALAARHARPVIGPVEHDRVLFEAVLAQLGQHLARHRVHLADLVVILGPVSAAFLGVGMVGRHPHLGGIVDRRVGPAANLGFVGDREIEHREERLARRALAPVRLAARLVPDLAGLLQVVVFLGVVRDVIAGVAEVLGEHAHRRGQPRHRAHVLGAGRRWVHPADDGGARRSANRSG